MTVAEFSREFDIQYNSISTNSAPSLDLYEKSVYLTRAQLEIIKGYFDPNGNKYKKGFEQSSKRRNDLKELIKTYNSFNSEKDVENGISLKSQFFKIPGEVFLIIQEQAISLDTDLCKNKDLAISVPSVQLANPLKSFETKSDLYNKIKDRPLLKVVPKTHDEFNKQIDNPFKRPNEKLVWRLDYGYSNYNSNLKTIELVSDYDIYVYKLRYIKYPMPIILTDLNTLFPTENLTIDGRNVETECQLNKSIHREILDRAVELALVDYKPEPSLAMKAQMNLRNE